jgi:hypothetical protein
MQESSFIREERAGTGFLQCRKVPLLESKEQEQFFGNAGKFLY